LSHCHQSSVQRTYSLFKTLYSLLCAVHIWSLIICLYSIQYSTYLHLCEMIQNFLIIRERNFLLCTRLNRLDTAQSKQSAKLFLKSSELELPQPLTRRRGCQPPPPHPGCTLAGERGVGSCWESPNSDEGTYVHCGTLYIYVLCGTQP
jgi:hypothetical protein